MAKKTRRAECRRAMRRADPAMPVSRADAIAEGLITVLGLPDEIATPQAIDPNSPAARNAITIIAPSARMTPPASGGEPPDTWADCEWWNSRGTSAEDLQEDPPLSKWPTTRAYMPLEAVTRWHLETANVKDYDVWHVLDDLTKPVPTAYTDAYGTPGETWETWGIGVNQSYAPVEIDGLWYRSNRYPPSGERLDSLAWADFITAPDTVNTGISRLISVEEYLQIRDAANPEPARV